MNCDLQPKKDKPSTETCMDTSTSHVVDTFKVKDQLCDDSNIESSKLQERQKQDRLSESVVRDVLHDVIRASAEMSDDRSTETTDSEMDITIDRIDINPLEAKCINASNANESEYSYVHDTETEVELEMIEEANTRKRNHPEDTHKLAKKIPKKETNSISEKHPGVFIGSETPPQILDLPKLRSKKSETELNKAILDSLPVIEKLRAISRTGSVKDDASVSGAQSEAGDNTSDKDSVASGMVTRNLRRKDSRKPPAKSASKSKKSGLNTRSSKGKGRRNIFKKKPVKSLTATATPVTADRVYFKV